MRAGNLCYQILGHAVATNLEFPGLAHASVEAPDFTFTVCHTRPAVLRHEQDKSVCWLQSPELSEFEIIQAERSVVCYPSAIATTDYTRYYFLNEAFPLCLSLTRVVLHASAVLVSATAAVGFIGTSGSGKSTLAATFSQHGLPLLADDCLPLATSEGQVLCLPGLPDLRLRHDSLLRLGFPDDAGRPIARDEEKRQVSRSPQALPQNIPLVRIYRLLPTGTDCGVEIGKVDWNVGFRDLMDCTYRVGEPDREQLAADFQRLAALAATGLLRRLSYPHDFAELDRVREAVFADVGVAGLEARESSR
jgi:hypothetical protein